jgi:NADH-quinone oxidoreductase subunit L
VLVGTAVAIAIAGIAIAFVRLKPENIPPKAAAPSEEGFERVLANKYYVDEAYDTAIIQPVVDVSRSFLWRGIDAQLIDGVFVNGLASLARGFGWVGSRIQSGSVGTYAWALVAGVVVVISAFALR